ncbi:MAG: hypothetical protein JSV38_15205 [Desulfobacterales bacterium]|nr:MAG: hypothetical protein JSV38_15205 [Desulfobacterales bacterium]
MNEDSQTDIFLGLSDGEKDDLEQMIKTFRKDQSTGPLDLSFEDVHKQVESISKNLAQLGVMLLKFDKKMKSFYKIIHLYYKKNEILNRRIDDIVKIMEGQRKHYLGGK